MRRSGAVDLLGPGWGGRWVRSDGLVRVIDAAFGRRGPSGAGMGRAFGSVRQSGDGPRCGVRAPWTFWGRDGAGVGFGQTGWCGSSMRRSGAVDLLGPGWGERSVPSDSLVMALDAAFGRRGPSGAGM